ncbi:UNVERIFIED_CONTAM: hypothetical protein Sindi_0542500, partial [Sesamum indicum]
DTCFKLHGTPDWYKDLIGKRKKETGYSRAYNLQIEEQSYQQHKGNNQEALLQGLIRLMKGECHQTQIAKDPLQANFAQLENFAGKSCASSGLHNWFLDSWIIDTRATNHMCANKNALQSIISSTQPTLVYTPRWYNAAINS